MDKLKIIKIQENMKRFNPESYFSVENHSFVKIFSFKYNDAFKEFIKNDRFYNFLILKLIDSFFESDDSIFLGRSFSQYTFHGLNEEKNYLFENEVCKSFFTIDELWDSFLSKLAIEQIVTLKSFDFERLDFNPDNDKNKPKIALYIDDDPDKEEYWEIKTSALIFFNIDKQIIFTKEYFLVPSEIESKINNIIKEMESFCKNFLEEKELFTVDHSVYLKWLQNWFPGKIKIRMLENS